MIHGGWDDWGYGDLKEIEARVKYFKSLNKDWLRCMEKETGIDKIFWDAMTDHEPDEFFRSNDAINYGLADEVI